ncbi:MAG: hypothetical protein RIM72_19720 [Alphaproteobacteria bacterium]
MTDETYYFQVAAIVLAIAVGIFAVRIGFRKWLLRRYRMRVPTLDPATVLFGEKWDIGLSTDKQTLHLLRRTDRKAIRVRSVLGYRRFEDRKLERGVSGRLTEGGASEVILEYKGDQGKEDEPLTYGSFRQAEKVCRFLEQRGFRRLSMKANLRLTN